ncbi:Lsm14 N-terminal [Sordaria brevicollis]|uniref:Lsm14 N-terminal n=1 Tax=Sordaria brevicollis TaxID=83679 RepID=A0AAE0PJ89_SORBR|nr:Lsm14 N-terminal [Sordaria brevicollis]
MSAPLPELGSRISVITYKNVRYEGRLFTIDPNECIIALAQVRCFGTEDRNDGDHEISAPSPEVHDHILFRGADIKDIRVIAAASSFDDSNPALAPVDNGGWIME